MTSLIKRYPSPTTASISPVAAPASTPAPASTEVAVATKSTTTSAPSTASATATTTSPLLLPAASSPSSFIASSTSLSPRHSLLSSGSKLVRQVSPGLLARIQFLNQGASSNRSHEAAHIGRLSEDKFRELDQLHVDRSLRVQRRGSAWSGSSSLSAMEPSAPPGFESDRSSFVSTSDKVLPSDSELDDDNQDTQKYRLPDITKSKSLSHNMTPIESISDAESTRPPTPPPKDTPPHEATSVLDGNNAIDVDSYFRRRHLPRANSIYTMSRASFTNQIQQLTSIKLPPPDSLSSEISALPNATFAARALHGASHSIKQWMAKAAEVLSGLDAEDDVEWAAAAGREGLAEVDAAIGKFEGLVRVYITAIEQLQVRPDITSLPTKDSTTLIAQMEEVVNSWSKIKRTLKGIKTQVEMAMEWEELWNVVLGEIGQEVENLSRLVFEMEERRHRAITESVAESADKFDISELETIVEETPRQQAKLQNHRFSLPPTSALMSPKSPVIPQIEQENSNLLGLFAKLQPLRASLDFLPMRLSSFQIRASSIFPSACAELTTRKEQLEKLEQKLEAEADALREELGEDKWVHSFRQAGSKAVAMHESLMKSIQRLRQAIEEEDEEKLASRISTYKDKREHYPPSMKRVLELIDIEMKHRSTVNGEILRIQQDVHHKVSDLEVEMRYMDQLLESFTASRHLRDSVSTVASARTEVSMSALAFDTPNSSPASSIVTGRGSLDCGSNTPVGKTVRQGSTTGPKPATSTTNRRHSSLPMVPGVSRKPLTASRLDSISSSVPSLRSPFHAASQVVRSSTPTSDSSRSASKPRWNASTNMRDTVVGHNFKSTSTTTTSPHQTTTPTTNKGLRSVSSNCAVPMRSPLSRSSALPSPPASRSVSTTPAQPSAAHRPALSMSQSPATPARNRLSLHGTPRSSSLLNTPPSHRQQPIDEEAEGEAIQESPAAQRAARPASAMNRRRSSMLPVPTTRTGSIPNTPTVSTPDRSVSRMGGMDEVQMTSSSMRHAMSGRATSMETRRPWR